MEIINLSKKDYFNMDNIQFIVLDKLSLKNIRLFSEKVYNDYKYNFKNKNIVDVIQNNINYIDFMEFICIKHGFDIYMRPVNENVHQSFYVNNGYNLEVIHEPTNTCFKHFYYSANDALNAAIYVCLKILEKTT